jgi:hypothetical protein
MYLLSILLETGGTNIFQFCNSVLHTALNYKHCIVLYCALLSGVAQYQECGGAQVV